MEHNQEDKQLEGNKKTHKEPKDYTLQDSSFDIELEYDLQMEEPYDKNRINTDHL